MEISKVLTLFVLLFFVYSKCTGLLLTSYTTLNSIFHFEIAIDYFEHTQTLLNNFLVFYYFYTFLLCIFPWHFCLFAHLLFSRIYFYFYIFIMCFSSSKCQFFKMFWRQRDGHAYDMRENSVTIVMGPK